MYCNYFNILLAYGQTKIFGHPTMHYTVSLFAQLQRIPPLFRGAYELSIEFTMQKRVMKGFPMKGMLMLVVVVMMAVLAEGEERTADCSKSCILQGMLYAVKLQPIYYTLS